MGSNNGTGRPFYFRCSACRKNWHRDEWARKGFKVILTGRKRYANGKGNAGNRNSTHAREYRCESCGHVGWSRHSDLERLEASQRESSSDT